MEDFPTSEDNGIMKLKPCYVLVSKLSNFELRKYNAVIAEGDEEKNPSFHYSLDEYIREFEKFLCDLQDKKKKQMILKELEEKEIQQDLIMEMDGEYKTNNKLVIWIIENKLNTSCLKLNWNVIDEAIRVLTNKELTDTPKRKKLKI